MKDGERQLLAVRCGPLAALATMLALLVVASGACSDGPNGSDFGLAERDSAGVRIVEHAGGVLEVAPRWTLAARGVDIGPDAMGGEAFEFAGIAAAHVLPGDTILVADRTTREFRFFGPRGDHVRTVGRQGGGPGEFGFLGSVALLPPDTLAVWDPLNQRITLLDAAGGGLLEEIPVGPETRGRGFAVLTRLAGGDWAARTRDIWYLENPEEPVADDLIRDSVSLVRVAPDAQAAMPVVSLPNRVLDVRPRDVRGTTMRVPFPMLFSPEAHVVGAGGLVAAGTSDRFELALRDGTGVVQIVRVTVPERIVTPSHVEALVERRRAELAGRPGDAVERELSAVRKTPAMEHFPKFDRVVVGRDSTLWARRFVAPGDSTATWIVFDPAGRLAGTLRMTATAEVLEATVDRVLVVRRDEFDVETVALRTVQREQVELPQPRQIDAVEDGEDLSVVRIFKRPGENLR